MDSKNEKHESIIIKIEQWSIEVTGSKWTVRIVLILLFFALICFFYIKYLQKESTKQILFDCEMLRDQAEKLTNISSDFLIEINKIEKESLTKSIAKRSEMLEYRRTLQVKKDSIDSILIPMLKSQIISCPDSNSSQVYKKFNYEIQKIVN